MNIYCLMSTGLPLTEEACNILFDTACVMYRRGFKRKKIKGNDYEGVVQTKFKEASLGSISGFVFSAMVETATTLNKVDFIVRPSDLPKRGREWKQVGGPSVTQGNNLN